MKEERLEKWERDLRARLDEVAGDINPYAPLWMKVEAAEMEVIFERLDRYEAALREIRDFGDCVCADCGGASQLSDIAKEALRDR